MCMTGSEFGDDELGDYSPPSNDARCWLAFALVLLRSVTVSPLPSLVPATHYYYSSTRLEINPPS